MILVVFLIWLLLVVVGFITKINFIFLITDQIQLFVITLLVLKNFTKNKSVENNVSLYFYFFIYLISYLFFLKDVKYIDLFIFFFLNVLCLILDKIYIKE